MRCEIRVRYSIAFNFWENDFEFDSPLCCDFNNPEDAIKRYFEIIYHDYLKVDLEQLTKEIDAERIQSNLGDDMNELFSEGCCAVFFYLYFHNDDGSYEGQITAGSFLYFENNEISISMPDQDRIEYYVDDYLYSYIEKIHKGLILKNSEI